MTNRHPATEHFEALFHYEHLPEHLQEVSKVFYDAKEKLLALCSDGPELTVALRKLWEAKNSAVVHAGFLQGGTDATTPTS